jgi:GT2 family glycosyltransferase
VIVLKGNGSLYWTGGINMCIAHALRNCDDDDYILALNNDLVVEHDYLSILVEKVKENKKSIITSVAADIKPPNEIFYYGYRLNWLTTKYSAVDPNRDFSEHDSTLIELTQASGRGTIFPVIAFKKYGLFDNANFPQYGADFDYSMKLSRHRYKIFVCTAAKVYSHIEATGSLVYRRSSKSLSLFWKYLTDIKSPCNLSKRVKFAVKNCPTKYLLIFLAIDISVVILNYWIRKDSYDL